MSNMSIKFQNESPKMSNIFIACCMLKLKNVEPLTFRTDLQPRL